MSILIGFILDCIFGDPYNFPHPVRLIGKIISNLERIMRKLFPGKLYIGGIFMTLTVLLLSTAVPFLILLLCYKINIILGITAESVMCWYLIAPKCLKTESMKVYKTVAENDIEKSRKAVSMIVGRDTESLDFEGIIKATVETVAENTSDGVTAPIFYMAFGGAVLGFFYKSANTMDSMVGYRNEKYKDFGRFSAKLDDVLNYIPSRLTAILMIISAYILKYDGKSAYKIWKRDRLKHASPNSAQTESVCAGALNIRLAGDAHYFGKLHKKPYIGDNTRPVEKDDIIRANKLMYMTTVLMLILSVIFRILIFEVIF
ncbi:MAG: adenosylcobinamide-phosphate synthase CbiB [Oscillospiraceae bacterium]|nr:adenosylcobinamide-phosphate synthase CbiB [Oscillospiraceae bacterium]